MGVSGLILKKKENTSIYKLLHDLRLSAERAGLEARIRSELYEDDIDGGVYTTANIADTYEDIPEAQQWLMYIYSDDDCLDRFDWILKGGHLIRSIIIEDIGDCEKILLDFLYEYLKLNPEDIFWDELDWFYTYEDIVKIKQKEFNPYWCYEKPHADNEKSG